MNRPGPGSDTGEPWGNMPDNGSPAWASPSVVGASTLGAAEPGRGPILDHLREAVYLLRGRRLAYVNREFEELVGYSREELTSPDFDIRRIVASDSRSSIEERRSGRMSGRSLPTEYEFIARHKDGSERRISVRTQVLPDPLEIVVLGAARDVTELHAAQTELYAQKSLLTAVAGIFRDSLRLGGLESLAGRCLSSAVLFTQSAFGFVGELVDGRLDTIALSEPAWGFSRLPPEEATGRIQGMEVRGVWSIPLKIGQSCIINEPSTHPSSVGTPPGHPPVTCFLGAPLLSEGEPFGLIALANKEGGYVDTDRKHLEALAMALAEALLRKRAEHALRRSESEYRGLVEHSVFGIYRSTLDGRFLEVNPALVEMLGYSSREELLHVDLGSDIYENLEERARLIDGAAEQERFHGIEARWRRRDGEIRIVRLSGRAARNLRGDVEGFEVFVEDVTAQRDLETRLTKSQRLEAIGQLAGGVAHDFNNLLTVIGGQAELALAGQKGPGLLQDRLASILRASSTAGDLTRQLLAFGRRQVLNLAILNVNDLLLEIVTMLRRLVPENIHIDTVPGPCLRRVRADPTQLEQVLLNLAANARDAMPTGGVLKIETKNVTISKSDAEQSLGLDPGCYVGICVSDTGTGMTPDVRARIFEPFFSTKGEGRGTGLGLATVYGIVSQLGGTILVDSEPRRGTSFRIYLQEAPGRPTPIRRSVDERTASRGRGETVLLVEDEPSVREYAEEVLREAGYWVVTATDGVEALSVSEQVADGVDLLLTDVIMPNLGGRDLADVLGEGNPDLAVLYMSGYADTALSRRGVTGCPECFLQKPFSPEELCLSVRRCLDGAGTRPERPSERSARS